MKELEALIWRSKQTTQNPEIPRETPPLHLQLWRVGVTNMIFIVVHASLPEASNHRETYKELRQIYHHHHRAESKKRRASEGNSGSIHPTVDMEMLQRTKQNHIYHSDSLTCLGHSHSECRRNGGSYSHFPKQTSAMHSETRKGCGCLWDAFGGSLGANPTRTPTRHETTYFAQSTPWLRTQRNLRCSAVFKAMNLNAPSITDINPTRNNMKNITRTALNPT